MKDRDYGVILFDSTQQVLRAEKAAKGAGCAIRLVPVPRQLSADCGVCLRFAWEERSCVESALAEAGIRAAGIHHLTRDGAK